MCLILARPLFYPMVKSPIRPSAKKVNTSEKQKRAGERNILLHSSGKYSMHHSGFIVDVLLSSVRPKSGESLTACQPLRPLRPCHQNPGGENFQGFPHCLDLGLISRGGETFNGGKLMGSYGTPVEHSMVHPWRDP